MSDPVGGPKIRLGAVFPQVEMPADPVAIRDYAQAVEAMGFDQMIVYDHVLGADLTNRPDWNKPYSAKSPFQEPLVLIAHLAAITQRLEFFTGVLVLPQRQAALVGKQAACIDLLSNGRLTLGVGTGWNTVEYEALGVSFEKRGERLDEQIDFLRRLWTEDSFTYRGKYHDLTEAGIWPRSVQRPIPIWVGGNAPLAMRRAARLADGWLPVSAAEDAADEIGRFHEMVREAGRDPAKVSVGNIVIVDRAWNGKVRGWEEAVADTEAWRKAGATHVSFHTTGADLKTPDDHIEFLRKIREAID
jgi:probable F420-dependent oxidoreductase